MIGDAAIPHSANQGYIVESTGPAARLQLVYADRRRSAGTG